MKALSLPRRGDESFPPPPRPVLSSAVSPQFPLLHVTHNMTEYAKFRALLRDLALSDEKNLNFNSRQKRLHSDRPCLGFVFQAMTDCHENTHERILFTVTQNYEAWNSTLSTYTLSNLGVENMLNLPLHRKHFLS